MVRLKKFQLYLITLIISSILTIKLWKKYKNSSINIEIKQPFTRIHSIDDIHFHSSNEWIFNFNITQYSSIFSSLKPSNEIITESLVLFDYEDIYNMAYINDNVKCLIHINQNEVFYMKPIKILKIDLMPVNGKPKSLFKIECFFAYDPISIKYLHVSIIDSKYFALNQHPISFQKAIFYNRNIPKQKAIVNCVHMIRNLNEEKLKTLKEWIQIQKRIGVAKLKLYFFQVNSTILSDLSKLDSNYLELVNYKTSFNQICKRNIEMVKKYPNSTNFIYLYNNCKKSFNIHFKSIFTDVDLFNTHERINTNDCYLKSKYQYEFFSNYDFDELIIPRQLDNTFTDCGRQKMKSHFNNIYDYVIKLIDILKESNHEKISFLRFENFVSLDYKIVEETFLIELKRFKMKLNNVVLGFFDRNGYFIHEELKYHHQDANNSQFNFYVTHNDLNKIEIYKKIINDKCFNKDKLFKWRNPYGFLCKYRDGKSIFITDFTEALHQHYSDNIITGSKGIRVPLKYGRINHIRDRIDDILMNLTMPFNHFDIDLEYFNFIDNNLF
jgi:hypothetical protein